MTTRPSLASLILFSSHQATFFLLFYAKQEICRCLKKLNCFCFCFLANRAAQCFVETIVPRELSSFTDRSHLPKLEVLAALCHSAAILNEEISSEIFSKFSLKISQSLSQSSFQSLQAFMVKTFCIFCTNRMPRFCVDALYIFCSVQKVLQNLRSPLHQKYIKLHVYPFAIFCLNEPTNFVPCVLIFL